MALLDTHVLGRTHSTSVLHKLLQTASPWLLTRDTDCMYTYMHMHIHIHAHIQCAVYICMQMKAATNVHQVEYIGTNPGVDT